MKQGTADHWRVCVGACIHHRISRDKVGGLLCDIWTGAAPYHDLDLVHIQVLEKQDQKVHREQLSVHI